MNIGVGCSPRRAGLSPPVTEMAWGVMSPAVAGCLRPLTGTCTEIVGLVRKVVEALVPAPRNRNTLSIYYGHPR